MRVAYKRNIPVYNKDTGRVHRLDYPSEIELSQETGDIANQVRSEDVYDRTWAADLMNTAIRGIERCPIMMPSAQVSLGGFQGGFHVNTKPGDTAFLDCSFIETRKGGLGVRCNSIPNTAIGGGLSDFLYGARVRRDQCSEVWNREDLRIESRDGKYVADDAYESKAKYYCAVTNDDIRKHEQEMEEMTSCLNNFDDMVRFSSRAIAGMPPRKKWDTMEGIRDAQKFADAASKDWLSVWLNYARGDEEAFTRAFKWGFGYMNLSRRS